MSKFIDLDILLDAKVGKFSQPVLTAGETDMLVSPIMPDVPIEDSPAVVTSYIVSGAGTSAVNGTYVRQDIVVDHQGPLYVKTGGDSYAMYQLKEDNHPEFWSDAKKGDWVIRFYYEGTGFGSPQYGGVVTHERDTADQAAWRTTEGPGALPIPTVVLGEATPGQIGVGMKYDSQLKKWMISDGTAWKPFQGTGGSASVTSEIIEWDRGDLENGILTINHGFTGDAKYLLGLDYTVQPKAIEFLDGTLKLDYSDQPSTGSLTGQIWFVGSQAAMILAE